MKHLRFAWLAEEPEVNGKITCKYKVTGSVGKKHPNKSLQNVIMKLQKIRMKRLFK